MTRTDDYRYRAAEMIAIKSKRAMQALVERRPQEASVSPAGGSADDDARAAFEQELYIETERALGLAAAALAELESAETDGEG